MSHKRTRREFIQTTVAGATGVAALEAFAQGSYEAAEKANPSSPRAVIKEDKSRRFEIPLRFIPHVSNYEDEISETEFRPVEKRVAFDPRLAALVILDVWSWHFMPSLRERMDKITRERIKPVAEACRRAGFLVVHTPSPPVAKKYPQQRFWPASEWNRGPIYSPPGDYVTWPRPEMQRRTGQFKQYSQRASPEAPDLTEEQLYRKYHIHPAVGPEPGDFVVATREELHGLLTREQRFHLFYVGFVSNGCILERDYGTRGMAYLGYHIILLRDCTTALETAETLATFEQTTASVHNLEFWFTTSASGPLLDGLKEVRL